ncbi:LysR family transcriptional regulator [Sinorhizobium medicae]|uniref:LysR family transcriptional regulator n=1 Tax=Sinorhizobium medicae TaxID=110321 RepID=UPI000C7E812E|nr:LysR family transcriptional regulator [Sinorhizobium medicae]MDX0516914.1 LysR family transcriptional regulator [Sinorhizobium medicae]MDX0727518.1 LysR family transcriptional regulator [Sinorhizobium medicae]MDX0733640.1 LysR family transcriptional regulator [Sinorhizobium medicae]MDX0813589.1 LysR family transcriptional regulator [Sinorhizobium medicae]MDX1103532.1 LysR family transcriptional regulator [Sinorhizobium medicae]
MPNLLGETSGLMAFVRTVEAGSFSAAARDLNTTPSAVSKSVARLEKKIGTRLFFRTTRALTLTQDGQLFFKRVAPLLRELDSSDDAIRSQAAPSGRLRISMPGELAPLLLPGLFERFATAYPDLHLDIGLTDRFVDLIREDYDVVLRVGDPTQGDLIVRHLADLPMVVVAGLLGSAEALTGVPFARFMSGGMVSPLRLADGRTFIPSGRVDCDSGRALIYAARSGLGAAYLLRCLVARELNEGVLLDLVPELALPKLPFNALHAFGRTVPLRVKLFCDFMAGEAKVLAAI